MKSFLCFLPALCFFAAGCSWAMVHEETDYDQELARTTLCSALEAWKDGQAKMLVRLNPPIRFVDDDLVTGWRLVDYQLDQPEQSIRPFQSVPVTLTLRKGNGAEFTRSATYQISLSPSPAVLRSDP